jgi:hypothetical protein
LHLKICSLNNVEANEGAFTNFVDDINKLAIDVGIKPLNNQLVAMYLLLHS